MPESLDPPRPVREWVRTAQFWSSAALAVLVVGGLVTAVLLAAPRAVEAEPRRALEVTASRPDPVAPAATLRPGTHRVGADIAAGRWRTTGPAPSADAPVCFWTRATSGTGRPSDVLADATVRGPASLYAGPGEWVTVSGPCTWELAG